MFRYDYAVDHATPQDHCLKTTAHTSFRRAALHSYSSFYGDKTRLAAWSVTLHQTVANFHSFCRSTVARRSTRNEAPIIQAKPVELPIQLIKEILAASDYGTKAVSARVCGAWREVALDALWTDLDDVIPLLELMGPTETNADDELVGPTP